MNNSGYNHLIELLLCLQFDCGRYIPTVLTCMHACSCLHVQICNYSTDVYACAYISLYCVYCEYIMRDITNIIFFFP